MLLLSISFNDLLAALTGSATALVDVNKTFKNPPKGILRKPELLFCFGFFILFNAVLAWLLYDNLGTAPIVNFIPQWLKNSPEGLKAIIAGMIYSVIARLKLTTITLSNGDELPLGTEAIYNTIKDFCFENINGVLADIRYEAARKRAMRYSLEELNRQALGLTNADYLKSEADRITSKAWIKNTVKDSDTSEEDKKMALAE